MTTTNLNHNCGDAYHRDTPHTYSYNSNYYYVLTSITLPNFPAGREVNFELVQTSFITSLQGIKYDYHSIMHYRSTAFTKNGQVTISSKDSNVPNSALGQRVELSDLDLQHARLQYNCPGGPTGGSWGAWSTWSNCSRACNTGTQRRNRTCVGGSACTGDSTETRNCNTHDCPGMFNEHFIINSQCYFILLQFFPLGVHGMHGVVVQLHVAVDVSRGPEPVRTGTAALGPILSTGTVGLMHVHNVSKLTTCCL